VIAPSDSRRATAWLAFVLFASGCAGTEIRTRQQPPAQLADAARDVRDGVAADGSIDASVASSPPVPSAPRACIEDGAREAVRCAADAVVTPAMRAAYDELASRMWGTDLVRPRRAESGMHFEPRTVEGALAYLCAVGGSPRGPSATDGGAGMPWLEATYHRARIYFGTEDFERAAVVFREVAFSDPAIPDPEGLRNFASDLYLDSLNRLARAPDRDGESCIPMMAEDLPQLRAMRCRVRNEDCERLIGIGCQIQRRQAEQMATAGRHAGAARAFVALANDREARTAERVCRLDEALYNAAHEFDAADLHEEARRARETLVRVYARRGNPLVQRAQDELHGTFTPPH
jgi:hypothetical protein